MLLIRAEAPDDRAGIRRVNIAAFGHNAEADLVDDLRKSGALTLSLVAEQEGEIVGHIAFSPVVIGEGDGREKALGLGPMAVLPERQRQGVGSRLVEASLDACGKLGPGLVVVLGHPDFYPRFGFAPAAACGIRWEGGGAEEAFMILELRPGTLSRARGTARYRPEFAGM